MIYCVLYRQKICSNLRKRGQQRGRILLPLFGFTETTRVLNPFRFSSPPFNRASFFFFYNILLYDNKKYYATTCQKQIIRVIIENYLDILY